MDIQEALHRVQMDIPLSATEAEAVFSEIMHGKATPAQIGALLMGLSIRGETADMIAGAARAMRSSATHIHPQSRPLLDTCGTGGDGLCSFNISTTVALVLAACGVSVAKHGNRAISSRSGSADVLEALGVRIDLSPKDVAACIDTVGIGFLFAPTHHPAMKYAAAPRREMGLRTIFNLLGPLTNPATAEHQMIGVYAVDKLELVAAALQQLGVQRALVVHGRDGMDEITTTDVSDAIWVEQGKPLQSFEIDPEAFGIPRANLADLVGGDVDTNAKIVRTILAGSKGAASDIVLLNAAAGLWVAGRVSGIAEGLRLADEAINSGQAAGKLAQLIAFGHHL